jgi:ketosteroid isomerase-like protein
MDDSSSALLHRLSARQEIEECMSRYAHAIDRHDEELIADVYHPDALDQHGSFRGGVGAFVPWVNELHGRKTRAHTHNITTHWCEIEGERAFADTYVLFVLYLRDREIVMVGSGRYIDRLERRHAKWKIADRRTITELRFECEAQLLARSAGGYPSGTWDRSDISYLRPLTVPVIAGQATAAHSPPVPNVGGSAGSADQARPAGAADPAGAAGPAGSEKSAAKWLGEQAARRAIKDCITQSVRGLDRADRELTLMQFAANAPIDDGAFKGPIEHRVDAQLAAFERDDTSLTHNLTSHTVEVQGATAAAETYVLLMRYKKDGVTVWVGGLRLLDRFEHKDGRWLIVSRTVVADFELEADGSLFQTNDLYLRGRRDRSDLSYARDR